MAEKVTMIMKLKVDLECEKCYKKVKKLLCKYPHIRDQKFDEKQNIVTITVVCCSPEKIRDKLCCKGGDCIKSIEIVRLSKPKPPETDKQVEGNKPNSEPKQKPLETKPGPPSVIVNLVPQYPQYDGWLVGHGGPPLCYCGYYARPVYYSYGGRPCYGCRCDQYSSKENASGCAP